MVTMHAFDRRLKNHHHLPPTTFTTHSSSFESSFFPIIPLRASKTMAADGEALFKAFEVSRSAAWGVHVRAYVWGVEDDGP